MCQRKRPASRIRRGPAQLGHHAAEVRRLCRRHYRRSISDGPIRHHFSDPDLQLRQGHLLDRQRALAVRQVLCHQRTQLVHVHRGRRDLDRGPNRLCRPEGDASRQGRAGLALHRLRALSVAATPGQAVINKMNARSVAAWSAACLFIVICTTSSAYKVLVLAAAIASLAAGAGVHRMRGLFTAIVLIAAFATALNFVSAHLGTTTLFQLPDQIPALGGPYTLEALAAGVNGGITVAAAIAAAAPFSLMLASHDVMDALPSPSVTGPTPTPEAAGAPSSVPDPPPPLGPPQTPTPAGIPAPTPPPALTPSLAEGPSDGYPSPPPPPPAITIAPLAACLLLF